MELTIDTDIVIEARTAEAIDYRRLSTGARWRVTGSCNQCGLCVIGAVGEWYEWVGPEGTPGASRDLRVPGRLDDPITPELILDMSGMAALTPTATVAGCSTTVVVL